MVSQHLPIPAASATLANTDTSSWSLSTPKDAFAMPIILITGRRVLFVKRVRQLYFSFRKRLEVAHVRLR